MKHLRSIGAICLGLTLAALFCTISVELFVQTWRDGLCPCECLLEHTPINATTATNICNYKNCSVDYTECVFNETYSHCFSGHFSYKDANCPPSQPNVPGLIAILIFGLFMGIFIPAVLFIYAVCRCKTTNKYMSIS